VVDPACDNQVDNVAPSIDPPGGLPASKVPMFVLLGFDDNGYADGINWVLDSLRARVNGDHTAARATFFISAGFDSDFFNPAGGPSKGIGTAPGVWEFPVYTFNKITGDTAATVTGFDYNLWNKCQTESSFDFAEVLKQSLDQRLAGNRSPFAVGAHTDIYSQFDASANSTWTKFNYQARRKALADSIDNAPPRPEVP